MGRRASFLRCAGLGVAVAIASACGGADEVAPDAGERTELTIAIRVTAAAAPRRYDVSCDPPHGTVPDPRRACQVLARLGGGAFAPVAPGTACTQVYGGPAVAEVAGFVRSEPVDARLSRENGCEIARWNRVRDVVPVPAARDAAR